jgi:REP element-mobilizing transposase RayT
MAIAFFSTWTTYGTWLPGDARGWWEHGKGLQSADKSREFAAALRMTEQALILNDDQRRLVDKVIAQHCAIRHWTLHAVNCRTNHVHVVVSAPGAPIEQPREQFKAWATRKLKDLERGVRTKYRTDRGWDKYIDAEQHLAIAINYTLDGQENRSS